MSIFYQCSCGRRYKLESQMAGKLVRCKQCGTSQRVPVHDAYEPEPDPDIYGFNDEAAPKPARPEPVAADIATKPRPTKKPKSRAERAFQGFLESLPRADDLHYAGFGVAALVATLVLAVVGGFAAKAFFIFVTFAAVVCFLSACATGLSAASAQGFGSALALCPALIATAAFYFTLALPNLNPRAILAAAGAAALTYALFFFKDRRGEAYRRPISLGILATLLFVSFTIFLNVARYNLANGITPESIEQTSPAVSAPSRGGPSRPKAALQDSVARALKEKLTLNEARSEFRPKPFTTQSSRQPIEIPPPQLFTTVRYDSPVGPLAAYLTPNPADGRKHPAIIWITGGDCNSIGDVWTPSDRANEQSASAYREAGLVMMFPALRGGNDNPGNKEGYLGEVDDILAAADFLSRQDYVDPNRIYLGGHSTGGTLALLVAESTDKFRAVFSFGPVNDVRGYPSQYTQFDTSDDREVVVRSPGYWLHSVRCPTYVFEGEEGNIDALREMQKDSKNPLIRFHPVDGANHFSILDPTNRKIAAAILRDKGPSTNLEFSQSDLNQPFAH